MFLATILAALTSLLAPTGDKANLTRTFKVNDLTTYSFKLNGIQEGTPINLIAELEFKTNKIEKDGVAIIIVTPISAKLNTGTDDIDIPGTGPITCRFDKFGLADELSLQGVDALAGLAQLPGLVPANEQSVGEAFTLKWQTKNESFRISGTGVIQELLKLDGVPAAKVKVTVDLLPKGDPGGKGEWTTYLSLSDGKVLKATGSLNFQEFEAKFEVARKQVKQLSAATIP